MGVGNSLPCQNGNAAFIMDGMHAPFSQLLLGPDRRADGVLFFLSAIWKERFCRRCCFFTL
jgi:hypothetical protein